METAMTSKRKENSITTNSVLRANTGAKKHCRPSRGVASPDALTERIKELNCLYGISNLLENQDVSLSWIMQRAVELIPSAWQYPAKACARIRLDGREYTSRDFKPTRWRQTTRIILNDKHVGDVDVYYKEAPSDNGGASFLEEEDRLLKAIGERLSKVLWLKRSEEDLKESEERYRVLTEQIAEGVALFQDGYFAYVNPAFCNIFGIESMEDPHNGKMVRPSMADADEIAALYKSTAEGIVNAGKEEVHPLKRSGKPFWVQVCHNLIAYKGRPALLSTFKDITEIKEQQMTAQQIADRLDTENKVLRSSLKERYRLGDIVGRSQAMREVYELILKAAATDANVAVFGESGSGKELVAKAIHEHGIGKKKHFVAVNCGAIQESLFEREFFGHRKGAFSGAHADSPGYLDMADGGTLFLDEVGELTVNMQAKLLRAIEEDREYRPVGSTDALKADFRMISASNSVLGDRVAGGQMRQDFFYRIQVIQIQLPPLRERREDIPLLAEHFLRKMKTPVGMDKVPGRTMDILMEHDWPGNVRELRNVLQRYVTLGHLEFLTPGTGVGTAPVTTDITLSEAIRELEKSLISKAMGQTGGNRTRAAALLGISRRALFRKMSAR